jgi:AraC family transcriptional regulator
MNTNNQFISSEYLRKEYISRINKVLDYIESNLDQCLSLNKISAIANFSPYHFHRIFGAMMGETLNHFIQRLRVERAANYLIIYPEKTVTEIALICGFSGSASFARSFKDYYNTSASDWRKKNSKNRKLQSKIRKNKSKPGNVIDVSSLYISDTPNKQIWRIKVKDRNKKMINAEVEVKELPEQTVAYLRHIGPYATNEALFAEYIEKLFRWAGPRGLINFPKTQQLNVYHDDPDVTDEDKLRLSICLTIPPDTETDGEIGKMKIPGGKYAIARFELGGDQFEAAWNGLYGGWLPDSGYQPADGYCFEICHNNPKEHPEGKHIVDICIPVKPL